MAEEQERGRFGFRRKAYEAEHQGVVEHADVEGSALERSVDERLHFDPPLSGLIVAEYQSLRDEIIKLIELQSQLVLITVAAFGTVVSVGVQGEDGRIILVHPLLSIILGISWINHAHSICRCARYLRRVEARVGSDTLGWEHFVQDNPPRAPWLGYWGVRLMFPASSVLAVVQGIVVGSSGGLKWGLFGVSLGLTILTIALFMYWQEAP